MTNPVFTINNAGKSFGMLVLPWYGEANPYQDMLYSAFDRENFFPTLNPVRARRMLWHGKAVCAHVHWDEIFLGRRWRKKFSEDPFGSPRRVFDKFVDEGGRLVWTVHNGLPHEQSHLDDFLLLRRTLAARAHVIHVHSHIARRFVIDAYGAPDSHVHVVPHPSYLGVYPDAPVLKGNGSRKHFLHFGLIRAYKGVDRFLSVARDLASEGLVASVHLAGRVLDEEEIKIPDFPKSVEVKESLRFIDDEEVPGIFAQADFSVLPYTRSMTSGTAMLSMSFGVPVIAPDLGGMAEMVPPECLDLLYDPDDPNGLHEAMRFAAELSAVKTSKMRKACHAVAQRLNPNNISQKFGSLLAANGCLGGTSTDMK